MGNEYIRDFVEKYGFEIIEMGSLFFKFFNNTKMIDCIKSELLAEDLVNALNSLAKLYLDNAAEIWVNCKIK